MKVCKCPGHFQLELKADRPRPQDYLHNTLTVTNGTDGPMDRQTLTDALSPCFAKLHRLLG